MKVDRIDHIGIFVHDLSAAKAFFLDLGLEMLGEGKVEGEWVNRMGKIIGLQYAQEEAAVLRTTDDANLEIVMLRTPEGDTKIELVKYHTPSENDKQYPLVNNLGIQHIAFAVEDIEALVTKLTMKGAELIGEISNYENAYKLCYVRGPEGIILELAEEIK